ncbi:MAG: 2TM domain-containing protein [Bacteroidota bacterium]
MRAKHRQSKFLRAKNRVEKLKKFYRHLGIYVLINLGISVYKLIAYTNKGRAFDDAILDIDIYVSWIVWGLIVLIHAFTVFISPLIFGYDWEERKIEQLMNEELKNKQ